MRLLIAKLASASLQSVSVALNSESDIADLATDLENCVTLLRSGGYDLVLLITGQGRLRARDAIDRLRREAGHIPMVVLTEAAMDHTPVGTALGAAMEGPVGAAMGASVGGSTGLPDRSRSAPVVRGAVEEAIDRGPDEYTGWGWRERGPLGIGIPPPRRPPLLLDPDGELLHAGTRSVSLSHAEARIFARLWESRGRIVSAEELMTAIYGEGDRPASRVLPVFLFKLRKKLASLGIGDLIETAVGRGFMIREDAYAETAENDA